MILMPTSFNLLVEYTFLCKKRMLRSNISTVPAEKTYVQSVQHQMIFGN